MSCTSTALSVFFLLLFLRVQSFDLTHARSVSSPLDFDLPEIDGSAVDTCGIFIVPTAPPPPVPSTTTPTTTTTTPTTTTTTPTTTTTTPTTTPTTTRLITKKQVVATTKKPAVQSPPRKPETKNTGTPITDSLLYYLLTNSRGHAAGSLPWFNGFIYQPMGELPHRGYGTSSDSDESAATLPKRAGRTHENTWKIGLFSSEDSSDES